ncbi:YvcK family protein [Candidatus Dojkabacteria bacterium]|nr:YvcK family protein [Candidatus Dojkabacteria bacterium]
MKITVIGGGTGTSAVLNAIKHYRDLKISVIVNMTDEGGSNKVIRDDFGLLPLSDLRKSIIALSEDNQDEILRKLFIYRFLKGKGLSGHTLGNLIMTALSDITGSETGAIDAVCKIFDVIGDVIPVTLDKVRLVAEYTDGTRTVGEHLIDEPKNDKTISKFYSTPIPEANPKAIKAIEKANFVIIGPGDLYTSTIANLITNGIPQALQKTAAKKIFISNLVTQKGQTRGMEHNDLLKTIENFSKTKMDYTIINKGKIPQEALKAYTKRGETVHKGNIKSNKNLKVITENIVSHKFLPQHKDDKLKRSLVRHDPDKLGTVLYSIFKGII